MSAKVILVFCAQALFFQLALSTCAGRPNLGAGLASYGLSTPITTGLGLSSCTGPVLPAPVLQTPGCSGLGYNGIGYGYGNAGLGYGSGLGYASELAIDVIPTTGGSFPVFSSSSTAPIGLSIVSENVFEGNLYVDGELPFASTAVLEGGVPSGGAGAVSHSCGIGVTAIESIAPSAADAVAPAGLGAYGVGLGAYGAGLGAYGAGLGAYGGVSPLSVLPSAGCNGPVPEIVAPIDGCYPPGIFY